MPVLLANQIDRLKRRPANGALGTLVTAFFGSYLDRGSKQDSLWQLRGRQQSSILQNVLLALLLIHGQEANALKGPVCSEPGDERLQETPVEVVSYTAGAYPEGDICLRKGVLFVASTNATAYQFERPDVDTAQTFGFCQV